MSGASLHLAAGLDLPIDYVTKTCAILAQRRKGKTYTANVLAEELVALGIPWVALDPTGAWWGLRAGANGDATGGLPVTILGGHHGDVPLERTGGKLIAELVVDQPGWYVLDLSLFESKEADRQFATDFAERLYRRKGQEGGDTALHVFVDEADLFVPQQSPSGDKRMVGAFETIVRRGGIRGIGTTLISQRAAVVNKNVLEMLDMLVVLRTVGPNDRRAIDGYIEAYATPAQRKLVMDSLASLDIGQAWVYEPGDDLLAQVNVRARRTFNSSATPKAGEKRVEPKRLADVDLEAIKEQMADTIERAQAEDPKALRKRIRDLEREVATRPSGEPERIEVEVQVEVPTAPAGMLDAIAKVSAHADDLGREVAALRLLVVDAKIAALPARPSAPTRAAGPPTPTPAAPQRPRTAPPDGALPGPQRKLLTVLAVYGPRTKRQLAMQAGYSAKGGGFNNPLSSLRSSGLVERGDPIVITGAGLDALGDFDPLPTGQALIDHWMGQLSGPERKILQPLIDAWPATMSKEALAETAGYDPTGGGFNNPLSRLRSLELVRRGVDIGLTDDFGEAIS